MKNGRGKRIWGLFLSVALVLSTLDVSTLTVTAQEGTVSESIVSSEEVGSVETDSTVSSEGTGTAEIESEISSEEIELTEVEGTDVSVETETAEVESTTGSEETETAEVESTEADEETETAELESTEISEETVEVDAVAVSEEVETVEVESSVEVEETEESLDDEVEVDGDVTPVTITVKISITNNRIPYNYSTATAPSITVDPTVTGADTVSYKWKKATITNGVIGNYVYLSETTETCKVETGLDAGEYSYQCEVTAGGKTVESAAVTLTVTQLVPTFDDEPVIKGTYGESLSEMASNMETPSITNGATGEWKLNVSGSSTIYPEVDSELTEGYSVVFIPTNSNYTKYSTKVFPVVSPKEIEVTINNVTKTYGDKNPKYTYTYSNIDLVGNDEFKDLGIEPKTDALETSGVGDYTITGKATNPNYKVTIKEGTLTITKKPITVTALDQTIQYGEEIPELTYTCNRTELVGDDVYVKTNPLGITLKTTAKKGSPVTEEGYPIIGDTISTTNYDVTVKPGTLTITPLETTFIKDELKKLLDVSGTYGETLQEMLNATELPKSDNAGEGTWTVAEKETDEDSDEETEVYPTVDGEKAYTVVFTPKDTNYAEYTTTVIPTVTAKDITVTIKGATRQYKETNPEEYEFDYNEDDLVGTDTISDLNIVCTTEAEVDSPVTDTGYEITGEANNANYNVTVNPGTLTIEKADVIFADGDVPSITGTYGQTLEEMMSNLSGPTTSQNEALGKWIYDISKVTENDLQSYPTVTGDTAYAVVFTPTDLDNYNVFETTVIPTVEKKKFEIQVENKEKVYGEEKPEFTFSYDETQYQLVGEDTVEDLAVTLTSEATVTSPVTEEGYPITGTSESENYEVTITPGTLMITQKPFTVKADDKTRAYGKANPEFTFSYDETQYQLVGEDTVEDLGVVLTTTATTESPVTEEGYPITGEETTNTNSNYLVTVEPGTLMIVKADIEFSEEDIQSLAINGTYGQTVAEMEVTGSATSQNGATGTWSLDLDNIDSEAQAKMLTVDAEPEEYPVKFTPEDTVNYNVYPNPDTQKTVTALTEISPKEITVQADDKSKVYGTENPELTFTYNAEDLVGTDTVEDLAITLSTTATKDSVGRKGGYPITGTSASVNYAVTVTTGTLTITQAEAFINIEYGKDSYTKSYGGDDFKLEGITTNSDGAFVYTLSGGMDADGQPKAEEDIITVSSDGIVTIQGSGSVIITVTTKETLNFTAAEPQQITVQIVKKDGFFIKELSEYTYTGQAIQPEPVVYDGATERKLEKGTDYTLSYKNSVKAYDLSVGDAGFQTSKAPQIIIKGKGNYTQKLTVYYTIQPRNINDITVLANDIALVANGKVQTKVPVITYNNKKLSGVKKAAKGKTNTKGKDFIYYYPALNTAETKDTAFKEKGTYRIVVQGTGNYTGTRIVKLTITDEGMAIDNAIIEAIPDQPYQYGAAVTLDKTELIVKTEVNGEVVELERNKDYTVKYRNNIDVGTATVIVSGMGKYAGTQTATFRIAGNSLEDVDISGLRDKIYNGKEQTQNLVLTTMSSGGETIYLTQGKDYRVTYKNNKNVGTAEVTIQGRGAYSGTVKMKFKITPYDISYETSSEGRISNTLFTELNGLLEKKDGELAVKYTKGGTKPKIQFVLNGEELVEGKDYTATYKNNKVITAEGTKKMPVVTIKGKGNFKGSFKKTYIVVSKSLDDSEVPVTMTVDDKAVSSKAGGYISKPVLTDADGKVLKVGKDYSKPVYSVDGRTLDKSSTVGVGKVVTVTVKGMGVYAGGTLSTTYRITNKNFKSVKIKSIQKEYSGEEIILTADDFKNEDGTSKITFGKNKEKLELGKDFEIVEGSYKNNLKKGTASVTLRGLGEYGGTKTIKFKIKARGLFRG